LKISTTDEDKSETIARADSIIRTSSNVAIKRADPYVQHSSNNDQENTAIKLGGRDLSGIMVPGITFLENLHCFFTSTGSAVSSG